MKCQYPVVYVEQRAFQSVFLVITVVVLKIEDLEILLLRCFFQPTDQLVISIFAGELLLKLLDVDVTAVCSNLV
jgi:hypothetical protein